MKSGKKAWFTCPNPECEHVFQRKIGDMPDDPTKNICPFCAKSSSRLCENTDPNRGGCVRCYNRTFATCEMASKWSTRNETPAHQVMRSGRGSFWFTCSQCNHDYSALLTHACVPGGAPCPYCAGRSVCDVTDCLTCASARNKPARIHVDEQQAIREAEAGRRTCDTCGETKKLESFAKLNTNSENRRATCTSCRNRAALSRGRENVEKAKEMNRIATKMCRECNFAKSVLEFGPGRNICQPCRSRQNVKNAQMKMEAGENDTQTINGLPHRGELPGPCRDCQLPFSLENASDFRYRVDLCKYMDHCNKCRAEHEKQANNCANSRANRLRNDPDQYLEKQALATRAYRVTHPEVRTQVKLARNSKPIIKLKIIRSAAKNRSILFSEEDAERMAEKLTWPCYYCGFTNEDRLSGLDRVDNLKGYTDANTVPCCTTCNMMKGTMSITDFNQQIVRCAQHIQQQFLNEQTNEEHQNNMTYEQPQPKRERRFHVPQGKSVVFYNTKTGRIAYVASSIKDAGLVVGITQESARNKIHNHDTIWVYPNWKARHASEDDESPNPEEKTAMFDALSQRGNRPRYTRKFQVIDVRTQQVIVFRDLASIAKVVPDMNLENVTKQFSDGTERVQINQFYWAEMVETEEIPNAKTGAC